MGAFVLNVTENFFPGISAVVIITIYTIKMTNWTAPHVETQSGLQGITISPISVVGLLPFSVVMDYIHDRIHGFKNLNYNPEKGNSRIELFSEPIVIGITIGVLLGIDSGYSIKLIMEPSVHLAAVMFLLPKCGGLIGKGIEPISQTKKD